MARTTAPSLWLPGFDPDVPEPPELSVETDLFAELPAPQAPVSNPIQLAPVALVADTPMDAEAEAPSTAPRANWRVIAGTKRDTPRSLWPVLQREHLAQLVIGNPPHERGPAAQRRDSRAAVGSGSAGNLAARPHLRIEVRRLRR